MSIPVIFYTFSKRVNSTLQPSGSGTSFDVVLKTPTSMINPTIQLQTSNPTSYNYCYIAYFSRYYFVGDWTCVHNDLWEVSLEVDTLASFKTGIGTSSEYVLRSASDYDTDVLDDLYPMNAEVSFENGTTTAPGVTPVSEKWNPFTASTIYMGIINNSNQSKNGAVTYYKLDYQTLCNMMQYLLGSAGYFNLNPSEISDNLAKALVNPIQYVTEAFTIPYDFGSPYNAEDLKMGWWDLPTDGNYQGIPMAGTPGISNISTPIASTNFYIPIHPQSGSRGRYMRCAPWSRYMLHAGPFGNIPIDPAQITNSDYITCKIFGNMFGDVLLQITNQYGYVISQHRANVKHTYTVGQVNNDPASFISGVLGVASGTIARGMSSAAGAIMSGASGIISNASNLYPQCQTFGTNSCGADNGLYWDLVAEFHNAADDDNTHRGRPLCQVKTINTLSGYIMVSDPDIALACTAEENDTIKGFMASGFYYE